MNLHDVNNASIMKDQFVNIFPLEYTFTRFLHSLTRPSSESNDRAVPHLSPIVNTFPGTGCLPQTTGRLPGHNPRVSAEKAAQENFKLFGFPFLALGAKLKILNFGI